jgi:hypothetical protein
VVVTPRAVVAAATTPDCTVFPYICYHILRRLANLVEPHQVWIPETPEAGPQSLHPARQTSPEVEARSPEETPSPGGFLHHKSRDRASLNLRRPHLHLLETLSATMDGSYQHLICGGGTWAVLLRPDGDGASRDPIWRQHNTETYLHPCELFREWDSLGSCRHVRRPAVSGKTLDV